MTATVRKPRKKPYPAPAPQAKPKAQAKGLANKIGLKVHKPSKPAAAAPDSSSAAQATTKQDRVLALLSRPDGASLEEIMKATDWQQHSVRGFLAGTVKKKLGFTLVSAKDHDKPRRYRIDKRRGR